jgi:hypothetical protein
MKECVVGDGDHFFDGVRLATKASNALHVFERTPLLTKTAFRTALRGVTLGLAEDDAVIPSSRNKRDSLEP